MSESLPPNSDTVAALGPGQLDELAASAACVAAAAFAAGGWQWARGRLRDGDCYTPDAAQLTTKIRRQLDDCEPDHLLSSGRLVVARFIEDGAEQATVSLDLGSAAGESR